MADETMDSVPGLGTIAYTIPYYIKFAVKVIEKAAQLKAKGSTKVDSPHLVEMALWTEYMLKKYEVKTKAIGSAKTNDKESTDDSTSILAKEDAGNSGSSSKRKADERESSASAKKTKPSITSVARTSTRSTRSRP
jgi:hypothetical protein